MKRKTKEIKSTARAPAPQGIVLKFTEEQERDLRKLALIDHHKDPADWAKKHILQLIADRRREIL